MPWQQFTCQTTAEYVESLSAQLSEFGAVSVTYLDAEDQPLYEPKPGEMPLWKDVVVSALFEENFNLQAVCDFYESLSPVHRITTRVIADQDWERAWMDDFKPMQFAEKLWICPSWCAPVDPAAVNILLDPGLAFGSGTHPTTALCLKTLASLDLKNKTVLDFGCGSGVLGIAASLLGAQSVCCVDNDPQALMATKDNALKNHIDLKQFIIEPATHFKAQQFEVVVANILAEPLIELADLLLGCCAQTLIMSGILPEQADKIVQLYSKKVKFSPIQVFDNWVCLVGSTQ